jgi:hypothetical protein
VGRTQQAHQLADSDQLELGDRVDADPPQPLGGGRTDARHDRDLHGPQELPFGARCHHEQAVRLGQLAGDLGHQLRRGDAHRRGQAVGEPLDVRTKLGCQPLDHRRGIGPTGAYVVHAGEVDERLIQRQRLHQGTDLAQAPHHDRAARLVDVEAGRQEGGVRAP